MCLWCYGTSQLLMNLLITFRLIFFKQTKKKKKKLFLIMIIIGVLRPRHVRTGNQSADLFEEKKTDTRNIIKIFIIKQIFLKSLLNAFWKLPCFLLYTIIIYKAVRFGELSVFGCCLYVMILLWLVFFMPHFGNIISQYKR